jgi:hypothetical protein
MSTFCICRQETRKRVLIASVIVLVCGVIVALLASKTNLIARITSESLISRLAGAASHVIVI